MDITVLIISAAFALVLIGLSIRANVAFRHEEVLPMQWRISSAEPLSRTTIWTARRTFALSFTPALAICILVLFNAGAMFLTPRPGQEHMLLPALVFIGSVFVAAHIFHLWMIDKTLRRSGG